MRKRRQRTGQKMTQIRQVLRLNGRYIRVKDLAEMLGIHRRTILWNVRNLGYKTVKLMFPTASGMQPTVLMHVKDAGEMIAYFKMIRLFHKSLDTEVRKLKKKI